jgi:hypothetical protein
MHDLRHSWRASWNQAQRARYRSLRPYRTYFGDRTKRLPSLSQLWATRSRLDLRDSRTFTLSGLLCRSAGGPLWSWAGTGPDLTTLRGSVQRSWKAGQRWSYGANISGKASLGGGTPYYVQEGLGYERICTRV